MPIEFLKTSSETLPFVSEVQKRADLHKKEFGFLPSSAYEELALKDRLWILISSNTKKLQGYLLFGGMYPHLKVFQLYVVPELRGKQAAEILINELITYGETNNFTTIKAKVATELRANQFWERIGFYITKQELGGTAKSQNRRKINLRSYNLNTPDLFEESTETVTSISYPEKPIFSLPVFTIDLNILYDILKKREGSEKAKQIFEYGVNGSFKLCVTPEFQNELERTHIDGNSDPIYEIAKALPTLDELEKSDLKLLCDKLRIVVFPDRALEGRNSSNDESDLIHLAYCSLHGVGFITREKAILRKSSALLEFHGITVVSPSELDFSLRSDKALSVLSPNEKLEFKVWDVQFRDGLKEFLQSIGVERFLIDALNGRRQGNNNLNEIIVFDGTEIIGFCSWTLPYLLNPQIDCYLFVNETNNNSITVIDHFIERVIRDSCKNKITRIDLQFERKQALTKKTAKKKGYIDTDKSNLLTKISYNGFISNDNWKEFSFNFFDLTKRRLPKKLSKKNELTNTGIRITQDSSVYSKCLSIFDFESLISPGVILHEDRDCLLLPIKEVYANDLLGNATPQFQLFPSKHNSL